MHGSFEYSRFELEVCARDADPAPFDVIFLCGLKGIKYQTKEVRGGFTLPK